MRKEGHDGVILKAMRPHNNGLGHITKMATMLIYTRQKKKRNSKIFPLSFPFNAKMLSVIKY